MISKTWAQAGKTLPLPKLLTHARISTAYLSVPASITSRYTIDRPGSECWPFFDMVSNRWIYSQRVSGFHRFWSWRISIFQQDGFLLHELGPFDSHSQFGAIGSPVISPKADGSVLCISDREDEAYLLGNYRGNGTPWVERCQLPELICHLSAATRTDGNNKRISIQNWDDCGINYLQRHQNLLHVHNNKLLVDMNMGVAVYQILSPANTLVRASVDLSK